MFVRFTVLVVLSLALPFAYERISPFRLGKVYRTSGARGSGEGVASPYTFLAEGTQSYVFLSKDQKTVLKLFKNVEGVEKTLEACKLALEIPELTGMVSIHLGREGLPPIALKDRLGRTHRIDPAHTPFILQKKASPFFRTLRTASREERTQLIHSFHALLQEMSRLGIANLDNSLGRNYGFIEKKAVVIDCGKLAYAPELTEQREAHMIRRLNKWLQKVPTQYTSPH